MRGEILSSVELVLPPNVVETCYNIKRDVQARFRAINDDEKTESEITVEKQTDDSVRIHVVVINVKCLSTEELQEENAFYENLDEDEPVKNKPVRGKAKRKARKWTRKKSKIIRRVVNVSDPPKAIGTDNEKLSSNIDEADRSQVPVSPVINGHTKDQELVITEGNTSDKYTEDLNSSEEPSTKSIQKSSTKNGGLVTSKVRCGRVKGRGRFRGRSRGRGSGRKVTQVQRDSLIPEVGRPIQPEDCKLHEVPDQSPGEKDSIKAGADDEDLDIKEDTSPNDAQIDFTSASERPRRLRSDIEGSTCSKAIKPQVPKKPRSSIRTFPLARSKLKNVSVKRKKATKAVKQSTAKVTTEKESCEIKENKEDSEKDEGSVVNVRTSLRKRKPSKPAESSTNSIRENQDNHLPSDCPTPDPPLDTKKVPKKEVIETPETSDGLAEGKQVCENEFNSKVQDDDISIQSQTLEDGEKKTAEQSPETVRPPVRTVRKRGKIKPSSATRSPEENPPSINNVVNPGPDVTETQPFQRVKTKAQLKQKPSELSVIDHAETEAPECVRKRAKPQELHEDEALISKTTNKKLPAKSRTLSHIWRTRKKSGFTRRKKSKPKNPGVFESEAELDVEGGTILEMPEDSKEKLDLSDGKIEEGNNSVSQSNSKKCEKAIGNINSSREDIQDYDKLSTDNADSRSAVDRKLPQKKRHTAKLAAEKSHSLMSKGRPSGNSNSVSEVNHGTHLLSDRIPDPIPDLMTEEEFNETSAIESLIRLSNATEESLNILPIADTPPRSRHRLDPSESQAMPEDASSEEINAAIKSISENNTCAAENETSGSDVPVTSSNETIQHLMKIAVGDNKSTTSEERPAKRAYKREFKVQCRFCNVKVKDYGYLFRHVKKLHRDKGTEMLRHLEEIRPLMRTPCPICHKMVSSISNISSHIKQCHASKDSAVLCPICKKTYKTSVSLRQHLRQCHQPQQHRFFCHMCSANFTEKRSLKEHINCSHETTQIFQCDECGKSFLTKGRLRRHKYIHGEFRHKCRYCEKGFHLKDNMNKHIEIVHEKTQGKRFECPHCEKKFTVKGNMTQHIMGVHLKQFQYTCPQCQTGFRRKKDMLSHMVKHGESGTGSVSGESNTNHNDEEDEDNEGSPGDPLNNTWHGSGEKTEVITGLAADGENPEGEGPPRKTQIIVITPKEDITE